MPYFRDINIYGCDGPYLITSGTTTIDLAGHGNVCSPLEAFLRISGLAGNAVNVLSDGVYVTSAGSGGTYAIALSGDSVGSGSTIVPVTVTGIQGSAIAIPTSAGFLRWNGTGWTYDPNTYLTGNQVVTLTGDVTGAGATSIVTTIGAGKVTNTMLAGGITANKILTSGITTVGTITGGTWQGTPIADTYIASSANWNAKQNAIILGTTAQYFRGDLSLATFPTLLSQFTNDIGFITGTTVTLTGDVTGTGPASGVTTSIGAGKVTNTMLAGGITANKILTSGITTVGTITTGTWQGTPITDAYIASANYWNSLSGGTPAGSQGSVQFKNGTAFAGTTGFTYDSSTSTVTNNGVINISGDTAALVLSNSAGSIQSQIGYNALAISTGSNSFVFSGSGISSLVGGQSLVYNGNLTLQSLSSTGTTFVQATSGGTLSKHILNNTDIVTALGYTPTGGISIGNTISGGTTGSVLFVGTGTTLAQNNANFFWDNPDKILFVRNGSSDVEIGSAGYLNVVNGTAGDFASISILNAEFASLDIEVGSATSFLPSIARIASNLPIWLGSNAHVELFGKNFVGGNGTPTAYLHLASGTTVAGTAPIKLTSGALLTTPENGALEYSSSHLYFTIGSTRYQMDNQYTFSTGLTLSGSTVTANLSTGIVGGQSIIGGKSASDNLVLNSTLNATKGLIYLGSDTNSYYDETGHLLEITNGTGFIDIDGNNSQIAFFDTVMGGQLHFDDNVGSFNVNGYQRGYDGIQATLLRAVSSSDADKFVEFRHNPTGGTSILLNHGSGTTFSSITMSNNIDISANDLIWRDSSANQIEYVRFSSSLSNPIMKFIQTSGTTQNFISFRNTTDSATLAAITSTGGAIFSGNVQANAGYYGKSTTLVAGSPYTVDGSTQVYWCDTSFGPITLNIDPSTLGNLFFEVKKMLGAGSYPVTLNMTTGLIYADAGGQSSFVLDNPGEAVGIRLNGTNAIVV